MNEIRRKALENIQSAQERQKKYYDAQNCKDNEHYKAGTPLLLLKLIPQGRAQNQN